MSKRAERVRAVRYSEIDDRTRTRRIRRDRQREVYDEIKVSVTYETFWTLCQCGRQFHGSGRPGDEALERIKREEQDHVCLVAEGAGA